MGRKNGNWQGVMIPPRGYTEGMSQEHYDKVFPDSPMLSYAEDGNIRDGYAERVKKALSSKELIKPNTMNVAELQEVTEKSFVAGPQTIGGKGASGDGTVYYCNLCAMEYPLPLCGGGELVAGPCGICGEGSVYAGFMTRKELNDITAKED